MLALVLAVAAASARAGEVLGTLGSVHFVDRDSQCELNPGLGYQTRGFEALVFRNSDCRLAVYAGREFEPLAAGPVGLSVHVGAAAGYDHDAVIPFALVGAAVDRGAWTIELLALPHRKGAATVLFKRALDGGE